MNQDFVECRNRGQVVLVDENDQEVGVMEKLEAHQKGILHRAFSVFIINDKKELLMQRRAQAKYHGGGLWTNTCCSHPQSGESLIEAGKERLQYEMGIHMELEYAFSFLYHGKVENDLTEYELDHVLLGFGSPDPQLNNLEVMEFRWQSISELLEDIEQHPSKYTIWFRKCLGMVVEYITKSSSR